MPALPTTLPKIPALYPSEEIQFAQIVSKFALSLVVQACAVYEFCRNAVSPKVWMPEVWSAGLENGRETRLDGKIFFRSRKNTTGQRLQRGNEREVFRRCGGYEC